MRVEEYKRGKYIRERREYKRERCKTAGARLIMLLENKREYIRE